MAQDDYEYRGLMAETWDLFRGDTSRWDDRFFYLEAVTRYGQPVLDVGCGTGRLLLDFLSHGWEADGVDISPEMLALLHKKAETMGLQPTTYLQSMEALDLPRHYKLILVPSSSFQLITGRALAGHAMERFLAHLSPGGALVMPFMTLWKPGEPTEVDWRQTGEKIRPTDGAVVRRWSRTIFDPKTHCESSEDRYEVTLDAHVIASEHHRRSPAVRSYTQAQARQLVEQAGFRDVTLYSGFSWDPAQEKDTTFVVIGFK